MAYNYGQKNFFQRVLINSDKSSSSSSTIERNPRQKKNAFIKIENNGK